MKKLLIIGLSLILAMGSCEKDKDSIIEVTEVELDKTIATIVEGKTLQLTATVLPEDAKDKTITWSSSDEAIATVKDGLVTAIKEGNVKICAKSKNEVVGTCSIDVERLIIVAKNINLKKPIEQVYIGKNVFVLINYSPENTTERVATYTSSNENIITVSGIGLLKGVAVGDAEITVKAQDSEASFSFNVNVSDEIVNVSGFRISPKVTISKKKGTKKRATIYAEFFTKKDKETKKLTWEISDKTKVGIRKYDDTKEPIFYFNETSPSIEVLAGAKYGDEVIFTATDEEGNKSECIVTVASDEGYRYVDRVSAKSQKIKIGEDTQFKYKILSSKSTDKSVQFFNFNDEVLTISKDGMMHPLKVGKTSVTIYSLDSGMYKKCIIEVIE